MKTKGTAQRRIPALLLACAIMLSLGGCGAEQTVPAQADQTEIVTPAEPEAASESTDPTEAEIATEAPSETEDSSVPPEDSAEEPALTEEDAAQEAAVPDELAAEETAGEDAEQAELPPDQPEDLYEEEGYLTPTQRNSINMLNYMTVLAQQVNAASGNQLLLESSYSALVNDLYPNAVDSRTQNQITELMDTINSYRMISVKRERIAYIYEQNRAQALRQAMPNPLGLLSAVQSGNVLKAAVSVLYMAVDSASSYQAASSQADLQYLQDGWELDDAQSEELHTSTKNMLTYMLSMVRDYDLPGDYALSREAVEDYVLWSGKPGSQLVSKIKWLESHKATYEAFGPYWLTLAGNYYEAGRYQDCLDAVGQYETVSTRIFRRDIDYAKVLPMAILSAKETMAPEAYVAAAEHYCDLICANTKDADWSLRYFAAQIELDLYALTGNNTCLDRAYQIAYDNVIVLVDEQRSLNASYLAQLQEIKAEKDATKQQKAEVKAYNKALKAERKIALPPVSEALYLNCDLLFALAQQRSISTAEQSEIDAILHENGAPLFLTQALDGRFWFGQAPAVADESQIEVTYEKGQLTIPAVCVTDRSAIQVTIKGETGTTTLEDWTVNEVKRPKNGDCDQFTVVFESTTGAKHKYQPGDSVVVTVTPVAETPEESFVFRFTTKGVKRLRVLNDITFERLT